MAIKRIIKKKILKKRKSKIKTKNKIFFHNEKQIDQLPRTKKWYNMNSIRFQKYAANTDKKRRSIFDTHHNHLPYHIKYENEVFLKKY